MHRSQWKKVPRIRFLREVLGDVLGVLVSNQALHGRTLESVDRIRDARGAYFCGS